MRRLALTFLLAVAAFGVFVLLSRDRPDEVAPPVVTTAQLEAPSPPPQPDAATPLDAGTPRIPALAEPTKELPDLFDGSCPRSRSALYVAASALANPSLSTDARSALGAALSKRPADAAPLLLRWHAASPADRGLAVAAALHLVAANEPVEADEILTDVLQRNPGDAWTARLHDRVHAQAERLGRPQRYQRNGVSMRWYGEAPSESQALRLLDAAVSIAHDAAGVTGGSTPANLELLVYPDKATFQAANCNPQWMGGMFDGRFIHLVRSGGELGVDSNVLRHETMHATIRELAPRVPVWLNEGMAEWFAGSQRRAASLRHWRELMVQNHTCIPFSSVLTALGDFESGDVDMAYAQSAAMVEFLVAEGGAGAPARALSYLARGGDNRRVLSEALGRSTVTEEDFLRYLAGHSSP